MKHLHLDEEIIQSYLFKENQDESIRLHLEECALCRHKLEDYQTLNKNLNKLKAEPISFDLNSLVMNNIIAYEEKKNKRQEYILEIILLIILIGIAVLSIPFLPKILDMLYSKSILISTFLLLTGTLLFIILFYEVYQQYKIKEKKIFRNLQPTS